MSTTHLWRRAAKRAAGRGILVAGACRRAGIRLDDLPGLLGCDAETAWHVALCGEPTAAWPPARWAPLIAETFGVDADRLLALAEALADEQAALPGETPAAREERRLRARIEEIYRRYCQGVLGRDAVKRELAALWPGHEGIYSHDWWPYGVEVVFGDPDTHGWRYRAESDFRLRQTAVTVWFGPCDQEGARA